MERYTLVIPAFNAAATIREAIESALTQSFPPARVIVVDDGSTDATADVAAACAAGIEVIRQKNAGPGAATARAIEAVDTPLVASLDADDLWLPGKAEAQLATLRGDHGLSAVFCHLRLFASDPSDPRHGRVMPGWGRTTMMIRTNVFARVGPVKDPPGRRGEMVDWLARAREAGERMAIADAVLALRRIRPGSLSDGRDPALDRGYLHAARQAIERRRARSGQG
jgi:glycosyltransferase involved in cell wall biosynthesis